jgi:hypothetical protein
VKRASPAPCRSPQGPPVFFFSQERSGSRSRTGTAKGTASCVPIRPWPCYLFSIPTKIIVPSVYKHRRSRCRFQNHTFPRLLSLKGYIEANSYDSKITLELGTKIPVPLYLTPFLSTNTRTSHPCDSRASLWFSPSGC